MTLYHGTAAQIIRAQQRKIENFNSIVDSYRGDIEKFCKHVQNIVKSLVVVGGTDEQVLDRMYEAFTETRVLKFNQEMQVWKSVAESSSNPAKKPPTTTIL